MFIFFLLIWVIGKAEKHQLVTLHLQLLHLIFRFLYTVLNMVLFSYRYYRFIVIHTCTIVQKINIDMKRCLKIESYCFDM